MAEHEKAKPVGGLNAIGDIVIRFPKTPFTKFTHPKMNNAKPWKEEVMYQDENFKTVDQGFAHEFTQGKYHVTRSRKFKASSYVRVSEWNGDLICDPNYNKGASKMKPYSTEIII